MKLKVITKLDKSCLPKKKSACKYRRYKRAFPGIAAICCKANKKVYIISSLDIEFKINEEFRLLKSGKHRNTNLQSDFITYGRILFKSKMLCRISSRDVKKYTITELYRLIAKIENNWRKIYKCYNPKYGYNKRKVSIIIKNTQHDANIK